MGFLGRAGQRRLTREEIDALSDRSIELREALVGTLADTSRVFVQVAPAGRELSDGEREQLRERLRAGAQCLSVMTRERELIEMVPSTAKPAVAKRVDLRPAIRTLRLLQRSIVLSMSADPERRVRAGATDDHLATVNTVLADLGGDA
jgi:hypothetical protein